MKKLITAAVAVAVNGFAFSANADDKSEALTMCKAHVKEAYADASLRKVDRIKTRRGAVEIKYTIKQNDDRIKGICLVGNGELTFTTEGVEVGAK